MDKTIKIILSVLFFLCLLRMPYGFYQFVRFAGMAGFVLLAYNAIGAGNTKTGIVFIFLAILFQPLVKIPLGREIWNIVDVIIAVCLIISIFIIQDNQNRNA